MNIRIIKLSILFGLTTSAFAITGYYGEMQKNQEQLLVSNSQNESLEDTAIASNSATEDVVGNAELQGPVEETSAFKEESSLAVVQAPEVTNAPKSTSGVPLSRGGQPPSQNNNAAQKASTSVDAKESAKSSTKNTSATATKSKVELLDWWKSGRTVFSVGTVAEITDVYTGKVFKAKRTMGTNHADTEALSKGDTEIIKSIWGGFSWSRRPVILNINGRRLAASMSAMPHAGIDSAPAYSVVNNRSDGYGKGENLDVIKNNGMDGHFDIHFLNSTRHKDGKIDPDHQEAIKKAMR